MRIFGDLPTSDYYYLGYIPMVDGYRHAFREFPTASSQAGGAV